MQSNGPEEYQFLVYTKFILVLTEFQIFTELKSLLKLVESMPR